MPVQVSVILPTYNQARYLPSALESVFAQTGTEYELIVVNDGSTDGTARVLRSYRQRHAFQIIEQPNQGLPQALNTGFARACGKYLTWTSSDNIMLPNMLAVLAQALREEFRVGLVYADFYLMDDEGRSLGRFETVDYDPQWLLHTNYVHCCFMYRRECAQQIGGYDPEFEYREDWEYWIRMSQYWRMKHVPLPLYRYRLHTSSMTGKLKCGTATDIGWAEFARRIRRRTPVRWYVYRLKRYLSLLTRSEHPVIGEREAWLRAIS